MPDEAVRIPLELVDKTTRTLDKVARELGKLDTTQKKLGDTTAKQTKRAATGFKRFGAAIDKVGDKAKAVLTAIQTKIGSVIRSTIRWGTITTAGVGAAFLLLARRGVKLNTEMEKYQITLNTILKSQKRANALISFIIRFAETTPFEVQGLVDLAAQIEAAGLSSKRWLPIVGDLSAAFGGTADKTFQLVRALRLLRAAVTGEAFETLRRFGIATREFEARGVQFTTGGALKSSPDKALKALENIVQTRFGGLMQKMSKTFTGTMSNIGDTLTNVLRDLMAPLFQRVTVVAREFLDVMERFGALGITGDVIRKFGSAIGDGFQNGIDRAKELLDILATGGLRPALARVWEQIKPNAVKFAKWLGGILASAISTAMTELRTNKELQKVVVGVSALRIATDPVAQLLGVSLLGKGIKAGGKGVAALGGRLLGRGGAATGAKVLSAGGVGAARNALFASATEGAAAVGGGSILGKVGSGASKGIGLLGTGLGAVGGAVGLTGGLAVAGGAALVAAPILAAYLAITNARKEAALEKGLGPTELAKQLGAKGRRNAILNQLSDTGRFGENAGLVFKQLALTDPGKFRQITSKGFDTDNAVEVVRKVLSDLAGGKAKEEFTSLRLEFEGFGQGLGQFLDKAAKGFALSMKKAASKIKALSNAFATPTEKIRDYDTKIVDVNNSLDSTLRSISDLADGNGDLLAKGDALKALEDQRTKLIAKGVKLRTEQVSLELKLEQAHRKTNAAIIAGFFGGKEGADPLDRQKRIRDLQRAVKAADTKGKGFSADELTRLNKEFGGLISPDVVQAAQQKEFEKLARQTLGDRAGKRLARRLPSGRITRKEAKERFGAVLDEAKEISRFFLTDFGGATREAAAELKKQIVEGFDEAAQKLGATLRENIAKKGSSLAADLSDVISEQLRLQVQFLREEQKAGKTPNPGAAQGAI